MEATNPADGQAILIARWIHFAAVFVLFGSALFWFYAGQGRRFSEGDGLAGARRATIGLLRAAAPAAAISGLFWLAGMLANMTDGFASVADPEMLRLFFTKTQFGPVAIARLALLASAVAIALSPLRNGAFLLAMLAIGALLLIDQAWLGHAAEGGAGIYGALMIAVYSVHALAAGVWVGGLVPLLLVLVAQSRLDKVEAREATLEILSRYSAMALVAVVLIVLSGAANAGFRVGFAFARLADLEYGKVLAVKAAAVASMLALAFFNRFVAMRNLRAAAPGSKRPVANLSVSVAFELAVGLAVLWFAAVLGMTPPPP
ncbi:CopD family protein [uncultured Rhodoblastus sp.]|uniref:CopD family protein n=1 Tax=uncultured Rhodoblastus sp. TaxID=543037 RepID=UPI0025ED21F0|nr:CopD family protein [uncultured Rhodoblastus sp.]